MTKSGAQPPFFEEGIYYDDIISSPLGNIGIQLQANKLAALKLLPATALISTRSAQLVPSSFCKIIRKELSHYFANPDHCFSIDLYYIGTPFQKKVWQALQTIPSGTTLSYAQLAKKLHTGPRAIGQACRTNPLPIIIPCHRIIAANNQLGGYTGEIAGKWISIKKWLLTHEGVHLAT